MKNSLETYPGQKSCLTAEIELSQVEKVVEITVLDQPVLTGFLMGLPSDGELGVRESIRYCCGFPGRVCTPTESNIETIETVG